MQEIVVAVGTRKGAFLLRSDEKRRAWTLEGPHFLGHAVHHMVGDPRAPGHLVLTSKPGHIGPSVYVSRNLGKTWQEATRPPAFPAGSGLVVEHVFWLEPGLANEPGVWWAGTSPPGLFRSEDGGMTWASVDGFNLNPERAQWVGDAPPGGALLHSICVDPRDGAHLYVGISVGGVFESKDGGATWAPVNQGCEADFLPAEAEYGHDPHCVRLHPRMPDRLYQQNHCGVYRIDRDQEDRWIRIGRKLPKKIGDIGFPIVLHPLDADTAWVFPMDGTSVWPRTAPGGRPAVYVTFDGGAKWHRQDEGLPAEQAWWTVKRQALSVDGAKPCGVYFGTTSGEVWGSEAEGQRWRLIVRHLPEVYSVEGFVLGGGQ